MPIRRRHAEPYPYSSVLPPPPPPPPPHNQAAQVQQQMAGALPSATTHARTITSAAASAQLAQRRPPPIPNPFGVPQGPSPTAALVPRPKRDAPGPSRARSKPSVLATASAAVPPPRCPVTWTSLLSSLALGASLSSCSTAESLAPSRLLLELSLLVFLMESTRSLGDLGELSTRRSALAPPPAMNDRWKDESPPDLPPHRRAGHLARSGGERQRAALVAAARLDQGMDGGGGSLGGLRWTAEEASTIGGIATVSLLHSFIPTHWLPFSIVARAQRWPLSRTLLVTAFGGILHVVSTSLLGITAVTMANTIAGEETVHKLASLLLIILGGSYILLYALGKGGHSHAHSHPMEKMAVAGLVLVPALSPCATTLPVFLAVGNSSSMMILAIIVLLFSTITVMTSLVALSFYGASQIKFHWVERYDKILVGSVLCLVGVLTYVFHHHDGDEHSLHAHMHGKLVGP